MPIIEDPVDSHAKPSDGAGKAPTSANLGPLPVILSGVLLGVFLVGGVGYMLMSPDIPSPTPPPSLPGPGPEPEPVLPGFQPAPSTVLFDDAIVREELKQLLGAWNSAELNSQHIQKAVTEDIPTFRSVERHDWVENAEREVAAWMEEMDEYEASVRESILHLASAVDEHGRSVLDVIDSQSATRMVSPVNRDKRAANVLSLVSDLLGSIPDTEIERQRLVTRFVREKFPPTSF